MGALLAYFTAHATAAIKRVALSHGLLAVAALITIFALGYAIDAGHTVLALRFGRVTASLIVAAVFLGVAIGCGVTAYFISRRPRARASSASSPYSHPPYPNPYSGQFLIGVGTGLAGLISLAALLIRFRRRRSPRAR